MTASVASKRKRKKIIEDIENLFNESAEKPAVSRPVPFSEARETKPKPSKKASKPKKIERRINIQKTSKPKHVPKKVKPLPITKPVLKSPKTPPKAKPELNPQKPGLKPELPEQVKTDKKEEQSPKEPKIHKDHHFFGLFKKKESGVPPREKKEKNERSLQKLFKKEQEHEETQKIPEHIPHSADISLMEEHLERISKKGIPRLKTGISGFDKLMERGIPVGSSVLVEGGPGSGKTIFCLQLANNLCHQGKKVLYMSFEEPERRLIEHMRGFSWTPMKFIKKGQLLIRRFSALDIARSVEALLSEAKKELLIEVKPMFFPRGYKPDIVLVDSLTSIASAFSGERSRFRIYMEQLFKYLEKENITSFLIRETPNPSHIGRSTGREEAVSFLSDGIITLYTVLQVHGKRSRAIEIIKLRGAKFDKRIVKMEIESKGIKVYFDKTLRPGDLLT